MSSKSENTVSAQYILTDWCLPLLPVEEVGRYPLTFSSAPASSLGNGSLAQKERQPGPEGGQGLGSSPTGWVLSLLPEMAPREFSWFNKYLRSVHLLMAGETEVSPVTQSDHRSAPYPALGGVEEKLVGEWKWYWLLAPLNPKSTPTTT